MNDNPIIMSYKLIIMNYDIDNRNIETKTTAHLVCEFVNLVSAQCTAQQHNIEPRHKQQE